MNNYFERIKQLRKQNKVTQKEIADYLKITPNAYQKYEYAEREPNMDTFIALANFFNVSIDYIVNRTENPEINK